MSFQMKWIGEGDEVEKQLRPGAGVHYGLCGIFPNWSQPTERGSEMIFITVDKRGRNTLPEEVRRDLGIGKEDSTLMILEKTDHGTYELVPASLIPKDQLWFHHPEMRRRVQEAEADFREGRSTNTSTVEEAQAHLDRLKKRD
jgi:bifunctional DNA-binding transcriptional regulator/antitoxin component of YhaV-PrlF toxin-antitoxin module